LPDSEAKNKLVMLCNEGFPTENLIYNPEDETSTDENGRKL
jgi:hypothetical protein